MSIWLLVGLLFLLLCLEGYFKGGLRTIFSLVGLFFAINLALPLSGLFQWYNGKWPMDQFPFWNRALPVITAFIFILLVFTIAGFVVHYFVTRRLHDKWAEFQIQSFREMDRKAGAGLGLVGACVYTILFCTLIYQFGNFTLPFRSEGNDAWPLGAVNGPAVIGGFNLNQARADLESTPFLKLAAAYDKTPEIHYKAARTLAKIYKNPLAEKNLRAYPGLFSTGDEERFQDLKADQEFSKLWSTGASLSEFLAHDGVRDIINEEYDRLMAADPEELKQLDTFIDDLEDFLFESGESRLYGREKIVGRWKFARNISLRENRRRGGSFTVDSMRALVARMNSMRPVRATVLPAAHGNRILMFGVNQAAALEKYAEQIKSEYDKAVESGDLYEEDFGGSEPFQQAYGNLDPRYQQLIGEGPGGGAGEDLGKIKKAIQWKQRKGRLMAGYFDRLSNIQGKIGTGEWKGKGIRYTLNLRHAKGNLSKEAKELQKALPFAGGSMLPDKMDATIMSDRLQLEYGGNVYVFVRY